MAGYAAALLDELMGRNRDVDPLGKRKTHWSDPEVCKYFLCSFCPHYLFTNTRGDLGRCTKIHDDELKASYQKSSRFEKMGYEREFSTFLQSLINEVDRRIRRGEQRLILNSQPTPIPTTPQMVARQQRVDQLTKRISELVEEAESLGCDGNVDQSQRVMVLCEQLRDERTTLVSLNESERRQLEEQNEPTKAMQVCDTCGALLVIGDPHQRMDEHVIGKQHMGYARIRAYLESRRTGRQPTGAGEAPEQPESAPTTIKIDDSGDGDAPDGETAPVVLSDTEDGTDNSRWKDREEPARSREGGYQLRDDYQRGGREEQRARDESRRDREDRSSRNSASSRQRSRSGDRSRTKSRSSPSPNRKSHQSSGSGRSSGNTSSRSNPADPKYYYYQGRSDSGYGVEYSSGGGSSSSSSRYRDSRRDRNPENSGSMEGWR